MTRLRPECGTTTMPALPDDTALFLIQESVERRKELAYGKLHIGGRSCAIGAFFDDNPNAVLHSHLIDEVAAVNDSIPPGDAKLRWRTVRKWIRWKVRVLATKKAVPA